MGYYTDYDFSDNPVEVIKEIEKVSGYGDSRGGFYREVKWYNHHEHMTEVSKRFPRFILTLEGVGEEFPDFWRAYYKNGKYQLVKGEVVYQDYDETKFKDFK